MKVDNLLAQVNNDKDTHKDKYKDKEKGNLPRPKGSCINISLDTSEFCTVDYVYFIYDSKCTIGAGWPP